MQRNVIFMLLARSVLYSRECAANMEKIRAVTKWPVPFLPLITQSHSSDTLFNGQKLTKIFKEYVLNFLLHLNSFSCPCLPLKCLLVTSLLCSQLFLFSMMYAPAICGNRPNLPSSEQLTRMVDWRTPAPKCCRPCTPFNRNDCGLFQQDKMLCHKAKMYQQWFEEHIFRLRY